jgi:hypothetical protein
VACCRDFRRSHDIHPLPLQATAPATPARSRRFNGAAATLAAFPPSGIPMGKLESLTGRALEIAGSVGDTIRDRVPDRAIQWVETGAALGALKTGGRAATKFVRRNPAVAIAGAVGAGLLLYAVRRQQKKRAQGGAIEGKSTRIEARKAAPRSRARKAPAE